MTDAATRLATTYECAPAECRRAGEAWYPEAQRVARTLASENGLTLSQAAGILASASLNQSWKGNLTLARRLAAGDLVGLGTVRRECAEMLSGRRPTLAIGGPKRKAFYRAIMGDMEALAIDRHAARAAIGDARQARLVLKRKDGYDQIADAYRQAAAQCNATPRDLQAVVWIAERGDAS